MYLHIPGCISADFIEDIPCLFHTCFEVLRCPLLLREEFFCGFVAIQSQQIHGACQVFKSFLFLFLRLELPGLDDIMIISNGIVEVLRLRLFPQSCILQIHIHAHVVIPLLSSPCRERCQPFLAGRSFFLSYFFFFLSCFFFFLSLFFFFLSALLFFFLSCLFFLFPLKSLFFELLLLEFFPYLCCFFLRLFGISGIRDRIFLLEIFISNLEILLGQLYAYVKYVIVFTVHAITSPHFINNCIDFVNLFHIDLRSLR